MSGVTLFSRVRIRVAYPAQFAPAVTFGETGVDAMVGSS
jgi:hypothetical protein